MKIALVNLTVCTNRIKGARRQIKIQFQGFYASHPVDFCHLHRLPKHFPGSFFLFHGGDIESYFSQLNLSFQSLDKMYSHWKRWSFCREINHEVRLLVLYAFDHNG